MKKINNLKMTLQKINSKEKNFDSIENISILNFLKYKALLSKKNHVSKQLKKSELAEREANFMYNINTKSWFNNIHISCKRYYALEEKARYKRDLVLYKLGVNQQKPAHPIVSHTKNLLEKITLFKKIKEKYNYLVSSIIPKKLNKLTLNTTKKVIRGFYTVKGNCLYVKKHLEKKDSFKYLKSIVEQASSQIIAENLEKNNGNRPFSNEEKNFRESIKFTPNPYVEMPKATSHIIQINKTAPVKKEITMSRNI